MAANLTRDEFVATVQSGYNMLVISAAITIIYVVSVCKHVPFWRTVLLTKTNVFPRQARDKHKREMESTVTKCGVYVLGGYSGCQVHRLFSAESALGKSRCPAGRLGRADKRREEG